MRMNINRIHAIIILLLFNFYLSDDECSTCFREYYKQVSCSNIQLEEPEKKCAYFEGECKEIQCEDPNQSGCENNIHYPSNCFVNTDDNDDDNYYYCEGYDGNDKNTCENIKPDNPTTECIFDESEENGNKCITKTKVSKTCEISNTYYCSDTILENNKKHCFMDGEGCKEFYKKCSDITDADECNSNIPEDSNEFTCNYKNGVCTNEPINKCIKYLKDTNCNNIVLTDPKKNCKYLYEGCIETYKKCELYDGNNQQECESIAPDDFITTKCVFKEGQCKSQRRISCENDYVLRGLGWYDDICTNIQPADGDKYCLFKSNMCFEHFKECGLYKGNNASICNKIIPQDHEPCEFKNGQCVKKTSFKCSDYETYLDFTLHESIRDSCEGIRISNNMKRCIYKVSDNSCTETYMHCYDFDSGANKDICEQAPTLIFWKKCVLESGTDKCTMKDKYCKEINLDSIKDTCQKALNSPYRERCDPFIGDDECVIAEKQCAQTDSIIEETCNTAKISSDNYKCVVSEDKKSCIEVDKNGKYFIKFYRIFLVSLILLIL